MTEPTRAQQEQVARDLLGWEDYWRGGDYWRIGGEPAYFPAWNSPDFLWPLCETLEARVFTFMYLNGADSWVAQGGDLDLDRPTKHEAVWAAALAVIGEG